MKFIASVALLIVGMAFVPGSVSAGEVLYEKELKAWSVIFSEQTHKVGWKPEELGSSKLEVDISKTQLVKYDIKITGYGGWTYLEEKGNTAAKTFSLDIEHHGSDNRCRHIDEHGECDFVNLEVTLYKTETKLFSNCRATIKVSTK